MSLCFITPSLLVAQQMDYSVKASYMFNFIKFTQWQSSPLPSNSPYIIGIYGKDPFGTILNTYKSHTINGRHCKIEYYKTAKDIENCHILFVTKTTPANLTQVISIARQRHILTVGDNIPGFCSKGGIINFLTLSSAQQFEINNKEALRSNIIFSSRLLALAKIYR